MRDGVVAVLDWSHLPDDQVFVDVWPTDASGEHGPLMTGPERYVRWWLRRHEREWALENLTLVFRSAERGRIKVQSGVDFMAR